MKLCIVTSDSCLVTGNVKRFAPAMVTAPALFPCHCRSVGVTLRSSSPIVSLPAASHYCSRGKQNHFPNIRESIAFSSRCTCLTWRLLGSPLRAHCPGTRTGTNFFQLCPQRLAASQKCLDTCQEEMEGSSEKRSGHISLINAAPLRRNKLNSRF